ncbi:hypothetical protein ACQPXH_33245 (plasmid) [Nocardia sp. CA-135953]|uniref:hypothetical protein n=1 Tax=Nocardia sp. CA-135953 TaxID=3239978 RepID=UPI003D97973A
MPRRLSKPTDVPENHERLIDMLWWFYMAANDPPTRKVARVIDELPDDQRNGTANHETIRRTLKAETLPQWETVEVIFLALCQIANVDPDDKEPDGDGWESPRSHRDELQWCYRKARYGSVTPLPRTRDVKARQEAEAEAERARRAARRSPPPDPWGTPVAGTFGGGRVDDEPPF